jgi:hypothetical protein
MTAACSRNEGAARNDAAVQSTISYGERVAVMPEGQRNALFIRAIRDAGLECQHVDASTAAPPYRGMPVWTAACSGGGTWTIVVGPNGIAQIVDADEARLADREGNDGGPSENRQ